ncbi:MAG TPA: flagellar basal-body rod protein FlgF [Stellaceae bacterium]|nr:flagellar basal-body rod protein FlgF [Stellaceae bacterium]
MNDASSVALSAQLAVLHQTDVIANNLANLSTTGFKAQHVAFTQYLSQTSDGTPISYVQEAGTARDPSEGPITQTSNPLDIAIRGDGYFTIQTPLGERFTRNGHFQLDADRQIVTSQGYPVLSDNGSPVVIPDGSGEITIGADGSVSTNQGSVSKIGIVSFPDQQAMTETAGGLYTTAQVPQPATDAKLMQGSIEGSNVEPIIEITRLLSAERNVDYAKTFINAEATQVSNAIDRLGKTV